MPARLLQAVACPTPDESEAVMKLLSQPVNPRHAAQVRIQVDGAMQPVYVLQQ